VADGLPAFVASVGAGLGEWCDTVARFREDARVHLEILDEQLRAARCALRQNGTKLEVAVADLAAAAALMLDHAGHGSIDEIATVRLAKGMAIYRTLEGDRRGWLETRRSAQRQRRELLERCKVAGVRIERLG